MLFHLGIVTQVAKTMQLDTNDSNVMDLLTKLHIVEKNVAILIAKLIHRYLVDALNKEYHNLYTLDDTTQHLYIGLDVAFNYRRRGRTTHNNIFPTVRNGQYIYSNDDPGVKLPKRYYYSSGKKRTHSYK